MLCYTGLCKVFISIRTSLSMPEIEVCSYNFSYLDPTNRFLFYVQVTRYRNRIEIIETVAFEYVNVFNHEYIVPLINERDLIVISFPVSDVFNVRRMKFPVQYFLGTLELLSSYQLVKKLICIKDTNCKIAILCEIFNFLNTFLFFRIFVRVG